MDKFSVSYKYLTLKSAKVFSEETEFIKRFALNKVTLTYLVCSYN